MTDNPLNDPILDYVKSKSARYAPITVLAPARRRTPRPRHRLVQDGWELPERLEYAIDRDAVKLFRQCVALVRCCSDPILSSERWHGLAHIDFGVTDHVGESWLAEQGASLGFSEHRQKYLIDQLDQEGLAAEGLLGSGG
jgi:hypothetical protein